MSVEELVGEMSYAEYLELERAAETKHEYVNGCVYAMAGGSTEHARLAARLTGQLLQSLGDRPCEVFFPPTCACASSPPVARPTPT